MGILPGRLSSELRNYFLAHGKFPHLSCRSRFVDVMNHSYLETQIAKRLVELALVYGSGAFGGFYLCEPTPWSACILAHDHNVGEPRHHSHPLECSSLERCSKTTGGVMNHVP